jgi:hypothetical protein
MEKKIISDKVWYAKPGWTREYNKRKLDNKTPRVIITGLGRSGTSSLMCILTRLGYDTGAEPYKEPVDEKHRAGFELRLTKDHTNIILRDRLRRTPTIVKGPALSVFIEEMITKKLIPIKMIIVPVREVREVAESRESVGLYFLAEHKNLPM